MPKLAGQKIRVKLKSFDAKLLDQSAAKIVATTNRSGAKVAGPIPLPTKIEKFCVLRSPHVNKESREQFEIRTHKRLIDIIEPNETYNAGRFGIESRAVTREILNRGKNVLVVGGSGLYITSMIDGFFDGAETDSAVRETILRDITERGLPAVYQMLKEIDPITAERIHPNDAKRIQRAIEVYRITGVSMSELRKHQSRNQWCCPVFSGLRMSRELLYQRIEQRVDLMIQQGVIEETRMLLERGFSPGLVSMEGLGYREITQYLKNEIQFVRMLELFKQHSRNYAKRQITWFGKDERIRWFDAGPEKTKKALANDIIKHFTSAPEKS